MGFELMTPTSEKVVLYSLSYARRVFLLSTMLRLSIRRRGTVLICQIIEQG